jgi:eukaryotic-like serine/threonine-protein kinase
LLPGSPDDAWTRLGPALRAQGHTAYRTYWSTVTRLTVTASPQGIAANTVSVGVELTLANGTTIREIHQLGLISGNATVLIDSDTVSSSETSAPPPPPAPAQTEDRRGKGKDGKGDKKGKDG